MSVSNTIARSGPYTPNGVTVAFPFSFFAPSDDEVRVEIDGAAVSDTLYTLARNADQSALPGGTVTFLTAPTGDELYVSSSPVFTQESDFDNAGAFLLETIEDAFDRAAVRDIALKDMADRAIKVLPGESPPVLPSAADRAGLFLGFDAAGALVPTAGTLVTVTAPAVSPEVFASSKPSGVLGDGTDDGPAFAAMCAYINTLGRGSIYLYPGRTYNVGGQTLHNPGVGPDGVSAGVYRFFPDTPYIIDINGCDGPVEIHFQGATIRCLDGARYGNFNLDGTAWNNGSTYAGEGAATPYFAMLRIKDCTGPVTSVGALELDGNIKNCLIGGPHASDGTGIQLQMTGYILQDNTGAIDLSPIYSHHHGLDGGIGDGPGDRDTKEQVIIRGHRCLNNGRQGFSLVGGNGWNFNDCRFNETGKDISPMTYSAPGAGFDLEAESAKYVINTIFRNCEFANNTFSGMVADSSANTKEADFYNCRFVGVTNSSLYLNRPSFRFHDCIIAGLAYGFYESDNPYEATKFYRCKFSDEVALSPTGALYSSGTAVFMDMGFGYKNVLFDKCHFLKTDNGDNQAGSTSGAAALTGPWLNDCVVEKAASVSSGYLAVYGVYTGLLTRILHANSMPSPDAAGLFLFEAGVAYDSYFYENTRGGFAIAAGRRKASADRVTGKKLYYFTSTSYDPPSLAAGASTPVQTIAVTGVALGDLVQEVAVSINLAGAQVFAWVSAADVVSYQITNTNGTNPLDLGSLTVSGTVRKA